MRKRTASWLAEVTGGRVVGGAVEDLGALEVGPDVVIDSRKTTAGALFVALQGEHVDGHDFVESARDGGAGAALTSRDMGTVLPQVVVEDSLTGLTDLATAVVADAHQENALIVLAITGSSGKTSTKDILAQLLEAAGPTVSPVGSFNNEIGVPLTACGVDRTTRYLVSEMGARGPGHITWLCDIVQPDVSLVLNVGSAHLGEFGSVEGIARAKGEIVEALQDSGWAVLNLDDPRVAAMAGRTSARHAWFTTTDAPAPSGELVVRALDAQSDDLQRHSFTLVVDNPGVLEGVPEHSEHSISLSLLGSHQVANAVAAAAAALVAGVPLETIASTLSALEHRSRWRMELVERADGAAVLNDAYNANPDSMRAALATLARLGESRRRAHPGAHVIAVLGDMLELGPDAAHLHHQVGRAAAEAGADEVLALGDHARDLLAGVLEAGGSGRIATREEASSLVLRPGDVMLVKASRGLGLERVADATLSATGAEQNEAKEEQVNVSREPHA